MNPSELLQVNNDNNVYDAKIINIIIIIGSTALGGPWPPQANAASDLYSGHPPISFYNPISLRLPLPRQSILISVGHVLTTIYK